MNTRAAKMAQLFRALGCTYKGPQFAFLNHKMAHNCSRGSDSMASISSRHTCGAHTYRLANAERQRKLTPTITYTVSLYARSHF